MGSFCSTTYNNLQELVTLAKQIHSNLFFVRFRLPAMADEQATVSETTLKLVMLDDFFSSGSYCLQLGDDDENLMEEWLWGLMPPELLETVLLFLPSFSQARFHSVCKRWREVMTFPAFQQQTSMIAFRRGCPFGLLQLSTTSSSKKMPPWARDLHQVPHKVLLEVNIPAGLHTGTESGPDYIIQTRVFSHGGLRLVGVAQSNESSWPWRFEMRCWVLNLADQTWQEVPRLLFSKRVTSWHMWLEGPPEGEGSANSSSAGFQLFLIIREPVVGSFHTYGSNTTEWQTMISDIFGGFCSS